MKVSPTRRSDSRLNERTARWSLELAVTSVVVLTLLVVLSAWDVRDSGWGSWFVPAAATFALAAGIVGGVVAAVSLLRAERSILLVLPIALAALCTFAVVGEVFVCGSRPSNERVTASSDLKYGFSPQPLRACPDGVGLLHA